MIASPTATTTYTVTGTDANGCAQAASVTITVEPLPIVTISPNVIICEGSSTVLVVSGASSYRWSPVTGLSAATDASVVANPTITTTYTVAGTDASGCTSLASVTVSVNSKPGLIVSPNTNICPGNATTLTASGATTYNWFPSTGLNTTSGASVIASPTATTTYSVTGEDANGCTQTATVIVTVNALPVLTLSPNKSICLGSSTTLTASGASSYSWSPATGLNSTSGTFVTANPTATTTYTVTGTDMNGCSQTASVTITVNPIPTLTINSAKSICLGNSTLLTVSGAESYSWSPATGLNATTGDSIIASPAITTIYTVTGTDANGCAQAASVTITVDALPAIGVTTDKVICLGEYADLRASGGKTYEWSSSTDILTNPSLIATGDSIRVSPDKTTTYTVRISNENQCSQTAQVRVVIQDLFLSSPVTICAGDSTLITATEGFDQYRWSPATGLNSATTARVIASPDITTTYTLTAISSSCRYTKQVTLTVVPLPKVNLGANQTVCNDEEIILNAGNSQEGYRQYYWEKLDSERWIEQTSQDSILKVSNPGLYKVTVSDKTGCVSSDTISVLACNNIAEKYPLYFPNIITPNHDNKNDSWHINHLDKYGKNELIIYNRWGKLVFQTKNYLNEWQGEGLENGVYYFWLKVEQDNLVFKGWIHLLR